MTRRPTRFESTDEVHELVQAFECGALPWSEWTHDAHVTVALWYLLWYGPEEALSRMRTSLQRYNVAHGVPSSPERGYHETITRFYMTVVQGYLKTIPLDGSIADVVNRAVVAFADRSLPLRYYSRERLFSLVARTEWVEPDLRLLDFREADRRDNTK